MKKLVALLFLWTALASCATTLKIEPTDRVSNLLIGQLDLEALNFSYQGKATVSGSHSAGIVVILRSLASGKAISCTTQGDLGIFYFSPKIGERYQITELRYTNETAGYTAVLVGTPSNLIFDVDSAGVTCLPKLHWMADDKLGYYAKIVKETTTISRESLLETYKDSKWIAADWSAGTWK